MSCIRHNFPFNLFSGVFTGDRKQIGTDVTRLMLLYDSIFLNALLLCFGVFILYAKSQKHENNGTIFLYDSLMGTEFFFLFSKYLATIFFIDANCVLTCIPSDSI